MEQPNANLATVKMVVLAIVLGVAITMAASNLFSGTCTSGDSSGVYRAQNHLIQKYQSGKWVTVGKYKKIYYVYRRGVCLGFTTCQNGRGQLYPVR